MRGAWTAIVLAAWSGIAFAAPAPVSTEERARTEALRQAGEQVDEAILAGLVKAKDSRGLLFWGLGFSGRPGGVEAPLPESIETLIVTHFADPQVGGSLAQLVRSGTYSSRRLFALLNTLASDRLARKTSPAGFPDEAASLVVRTTLPGIEEPLQRLVERHCAFGPPEPMHARNARECEALERFLVIRRHEPARAWLAAQVAAQVAAATGKSYEPRISWLSAFGDRQSAELLTGLLEAAVGAPSARDAGYGAGEILAKFQYFGKAVPVDYERLRRAIKAMPTGYVAYPAALLVLNRKEPAGAGLLAEALGVDPSAHWSPDGIVAGLSRLESREAWQGLRDELLSLKRAGPLKPAQERALAGSQELLRIVERDAQNRQVHEGAARNYREGAAIREATRQRESERVAPLAEARRLASQQPAEASKLYRRFIESLFGDARFKGNGGEVQAVRQELASTVDEAVRHDRYARREPRAAVEVLRLALKAPPPSDFRGPDERVGWHAQIGDILHFDLREREAAAREFDAAAALVRRDWKEKDMAPVFIGGTLEWLAAESAFLRHGKTVRGEASEGLRAALGSRVVFEGQPALAEVERSLEKPGASREAALRAKAHSILQALPPSRANMKGLVRWSGAFPDEDSLRRFVERNDPAGAWTLVALGGLLRLEREGACDDPRAGDLFPWVCDGGGKKHPVFEAARRILAARGVPEPAAADSGLSTPEGTWSIFIGALRAGNRDAALACMTPELRERFRGPLHDLDTARLRAMADEFSPVAMGRPMGLFREAHVTRTRGGRKEAVLVYFLRQGGQWLINEM